MFISLSQTRREGSMSLEMRESCERCAAALPGNSADARICSHECTFCKTCSAAMSERCPNCGGELVARPRRAKRE